MAFARLTSLFVRFDRITPFPASNGKLVSTDPMDDDDALTDSEIDAEFERTAYIGHAINAIAQAEDAVAAVDELPADARARLDQILSNILGA